MGMLLPPKSLVFFAENSFRSFEPASANLGCAGIGEELPHTVFSNI
jgi:hypothetical protein